MSAYDKSGQESKGTPINDVPNGTDPIRRPKAKLPPVLDFALPAIAIGSGAMLFLAVPNIIEGNDAWSYAKAFTLAASATTVSFGINKLAIERGAGLTSKGYWGAGVVSIGSIVVVGGGLFAATYAGLVLKDVAELQLQEHGTDLGTYVGARSAAASKAARVDPVVRGIVGDLQQKTDCEIKVSCISGRGNGGHGPVARVMEDYSGRAASIGDQITAGANKRVTILGQLNEEIAGYQVTLGKTEEDVWQRRSDLQVIDARIRQLVGELSETVPLSLLGAYASELQSGVAIPGEAEAQRRLNDLLGRHGKSLSAVISSIEDDAGQAPAFPLRTGVSVTFNYIAHFMPVAAITAVVELVFPLVLWFYTLWALSWGVFAREHRQQAAGNAGTPNAGAVALPAPAERTRDEQSSPEDRLPRDDRSRHDRRRHNRSENNQRDQQVSRSQSDNNVAAFRPRKRRSGRAGGSTDEPE